MALFCKKNKVISIFTGDLFHKEKGLTNEILESSLPFLSKMYSSGNFLTYAISGNHDQSQQNLIGNESPSYVKTLAKTFKGLKCFDFNSFEIPDTNIIVHGIPYITHDIGLIDYIDSIDTSPAYKNVLALHTTLPNSKDTDGKEMTSNFENNEFANAIQKFDLVICGHIHKPMKYKIGNTQVVQIGAPQHQRLTDRKCKMGYWIMYDNLQMEFVHLKKYPKFIQVDDISEKIDNHNFYVVSEKEDNSLEDELEEKRDFSNKISRRKLARNYCKEKQIKDKKKVNALAKALKDTE
jgi:DNA repair exonuclease SbcCD nuclease subunit